MIDPATGTYYGMKGGDLPDSSQNCVRYQTDDYSMVVCWNRSDIGEGSGHDSWWYPDFPAVLSAARSTTWDAGDLFPAFGMPTLVPRRPPRPPRRHGPDRESRGGEGLQSSPPRL